MNKLDKIIELLTQIEINTRKSTKKKSENKPKPLELKEYPRLVEIWNKYCGELPKVEVITRAQTRYKKAVERWLESPNELYWNKVVRKIAESDFCNGKNERSWKANFEFLVRADTSSKVIDGKYDNKCKNNKTYLGTTESGRKIFG